MELRETKPTLIEYLNPSDRIDESAGILKGVKVIGFNSRNNRRYNESTLREAVSLYDGAKIYINHPDRNNLNSDRKFESWAGVMRNPQFIAGKGIFADAHLRQEGGYFKGIVEAASKFPNETGFSHVADGESKLEGDMEIVESIREVFSVDLVCDPATTNGFFESTMKTKKRTIKELAESLPEGTTRKVLIEATDKIIESGYDLGSFEMGDESAEPTGAGGTEALLQHTIDALTKTNEMLLMVLAKGKAASAPPAPTPPAEPPVASDPPAEDPPAEDPEKEKIAAMAAENARLKATNMLLESGREVTDARVKALASADDADKPELLESWAVVEEIERPVIFGIRESVDVKELDFSTKGSFAARYK